jgi:redox-sensitive bicupin YhaK (pirin superfamily)
MTAGAGILHIEVPSEEIVISGGVVHGTQLWVKPRYQDIPRNNLALLSSHDGGSLIRVIAGSLDGHDGPGVTYSPITYVHATVSPGAQLEIPWEKDYNALGYVLAGNGTVGPDRRPIHLG